MATPLKQPLIPGETIQQRKNRFRRERRQADPLYRARLNAITLKSHHRAKAENPEIMKEYERQRWHQTKTNPTHKAARKNQALRRMYSITLDEFNVMSERQHNKCAICEQTPISRCLMVDHDHHTGVVRGLLCNNCNRGIGSFLDMPEILRKAAEYLDKCTA